MRIDVAFLPDHLDAVSGRVALVIDVLRATSTAVALFEAGASEVLLAVDLHEARRLKAEHAALLVGEEVGRTTPAEGCDLSPSPVALQGRDLRGRTVVLSTTNGSVVLRRVLAAPAPSVYVAALANLGAAAAVALDDACLAGRDLAVVCAGRRGSRRFAVDDACCAGLLVERLVAAAGARGVSVALEDGAVGARRLAAGFATPEEALAASDTGRMLVADGQAEDIAWCARMDWSRLVPEVRRTDDRFRLVVARTAQTADTAGAEGRR